METLSALLALCAENSRVTGKFPSQSPVTRSFDVNFDLWRYIDQYTHYSRYMVLINTKVTIKPSMYLEVI